MLKITTKRGTNLRISSKGEEKANRNRSRLYGIHSKLCQMALSLMKDRNQKYARADDPSALRTYLGVR